MKTHLAQHSGMYKCGKCSYTASELNHLHQHECKESVAKVDQTNVHSENETIVDAVAYDGSGDVGATSVRCAALKSEPVHMIETTVSNHESHHPQLASSIGVRGRSSSLSLEDRDVTATLEGQDVSEFKPVRIMEAHHQQPASSFAVNGCWTMKAVSNDELSRQQLVMEHPSYNDVLECADVAATSVAQTASKSELVQLMDLQTMNGTAESRGCYLMIC